MDGIRLAGAWIDEVHALDAAASPPPVIGVYIEGQEGTILPLWTRPWLVEKYGDRVREARAVEGIEE
jgi:hypothetical protein